MVGCVLILMNAPVFYQDQICRVMKTQRMVFEMIERLYHEYSLVFTFITPRTLVPSNKNYLQILVCLI